MKHERHSNLKQFLLYVLPGILVTLSVLSAYVAQIEYFKRLDLRIYDRFLRHTAGGEPSDIPILIDIDEKSIFKYGQWPWPRYIIADILTKLHENGIAAVGVTFLMPTPDRTSPELLLKQLSENFGVDIPKEVFPEELYNNDDMLAKVLSRVPAVLSCYVSDDAEGFDGAAFPDTKPPPVRIAESRAPGTPPLADSLISGEFLIMPIPKLAKAARGIGAINAARDFDGIHRRVPLFVSHEGNVIPGLALAALALAAADGKTPAQFTAKTGDDVPEYMKLPDITIPMSRDGSLPVLFRHPNRHKIYSASDIAEGLIPREQLSGKIAFLGSTMAGLKDSRAAPFDNNYSGLQMHADIIDAILSERFIVTPAWAPEAEFLLILGTGLISILLSAMASPLVYITAVISGILAIWHGSAWLFISKGMFFSPSYPFLLIVLNSFCILGIKFRMEEKSKRVLKKAFSNYVSPEIVSRIMMKGNVSSLRGESREVTVMFTDIRGFTAIAEKLPPTQVVDILGRYFSPMTMLVRDSGGTLDKFVGDAMMAFWNAPVDVANHSKIAVQTLLDMHAELSELNTAIEKEMGITLKIGGAVHTGMAHAGNMGTEELMDYTVIGDTVNTASRLEGMCSKYEIDSIVSGEARSFCINDFGWQIIDNIRVKGRARAVEIWAPMSMEEAESRKNELSDWNTAYELYRGGKFSEAYMMLDNLTERFRGMKLYEMFKDRCYELKGNYPENWDGIHSYDLK